VLLAAGRLTPRAGRLPPHGRLPRPHQPWTGGGSALRAAATIRASNPPAARHLDVRGPMQQQTRPAPSWLHRRHVRGHKRPEAMQQPPERQVLLLGRGALSSF
jgi:hypothetical protein